MFTAKEMQPVMLRPMDLVLDWLKARGTTLIPHEDIGAAMLWLTVYFVTIGGLVGGMIGLVTALLPWQTIKTTNQDTGRTTDGTIRR